MRKATAQLLRSIDNLRLHLSANRACLGRRLAERPSAPPALDYGPVFEHLETELVTVRGGLGDAEAAYDVAQPVVTECRNARDRTFARLSDLHAPIPRLLQHLGVVAPKVAATKSAEELNAQVAMTVFVLRDLEHDPPSPVAGVCLDPGPVAEELTAGRRRLEADCKSLAAAESELRFAREVANKAFARAERVRSWVSRTLESLDGLAREGESGGRPRNGVG